MLFSVQLFFQLSSSAPLCSFWNGNFHFYFIAFPGSSESAILCRRLWTPGGLCSCHWKRTEVPSLLWQGQRVFWDSYTSCISLGFFLSFFFFSGYNTVKFQYEWPLFLLLQEVVGGMLDLEPRRWRKMIKENFDDQRKKVLQFSQWWKPHDCTKTQG